MCSCAFVVVGYFLDMDTTISPSKCVCVCMPMYGFRLFHKSACGILTLNFKNKKYTFFTHINSVFTTKI